ELQGAWRVCGTDAWRPMPFDGLPVVESRDSAPIDRPLAIAATPDGPGFEAAVGRTVNRIHNGELFQVNLCRRLEAALPCSDIWPLYLQLREISPATYGALMKVGDRG